MSKNSYIFARRDGRSGRFTKFVWDSGVPEKEGWELDETRTDEKAIPVKKAAAAKSVKSDLSKEERYKQLMNQASGFEKDKNYGKALGKYGEAYKLKQTKTLEKKMAQMEKFINQDEEPAKDATVLAADEAYENDDLMLALELYEAAPDQSDEYVVSRIAEINAKLDAEAA